jgi:hypothetical protein
LGSEEVTRDLSACPGFARKLAMNAQPTIASSFVVLEKYSICFWENGISQSAVVNTHF